MKDRGNTSGRMGGTSGATKTKPGVGINDGPQPRPILTDDSTLGDLEDEIKWIQCSLVNAIIANTGVITTCARSKRRWNEDSRTKRRGLCRTTRRRRGAAQQDVRTAKRTLRGAIWKARKEF